jgi:hypothetical protein
MSGKVIHMPDVHNSRGLLTTALTGVIHSTPCPECGYPEETEDGYCADCGVDRHGVSDHAAAAAQALRLVPPRSSSDADCPRRRTGHGD